MKQSEIATLGFHILDAELRRKKEMLESFTYNCSHSIRSPLKSMEGILKLLKSYPDAVAADATDYRALLATEATRLRTIVFHFDEMRINREKALTFSRIDLPKLIERVVEPFRERLREHSIRIETRINQKGDFLSDSTRLETIVSELILNAIRFHDPEKTDREIAIYITASPSSCSIQVHDNGVGIRADDLTKVFNLFFRGTEISGGSGLGLFVTKQIVERLNGTITVQSALSAKTIFSLWLPNRKA